MNLLFDRQTTSAKQRTPSMRFQQLDHVYRRNPLENHNKDVFNQKTPIPARPTGPQDRRQQEKSRQNLASSSSSSQHCGAHLLDCSSNFIESVLHVLHLCSAALYNLPNFSIHTPRSSLFRVTQAMHCSASVPGDSGNGTRFRSCPPT